MMATVGIVMLSKNVENDSVGKEMPWLRTAAKSSSFAPFCGSFSTISKYTAAQNEFTPMTTNGTRHPKDCKLYPVKS
jgi:hypothetical protein